MSDLALWMLCIGLTLTAIGFTWPLVRAAHTRQRINDPLPRQAASDRSEYVRLRKAMMPDELPMPPDCPQEEIDIDTLWARRN